MNDCQNINCINYAELNAKDYSAEKMLAAAKRYFKVTKIAKIGKYPLFVMDVE